MKTSVLVAALGVLGSLGLLAQAPRGGQGGDPKAPVFWSAQSMKEIAARASTRVSPQTNKAGERLIGSANVIYRNGDSGSEIHEKLADFIFIQEGEGSILIGGKLIGGQSSGPTKSGDSLIEGGTRYPVSRRRQDLHPGQYASSVLCGEGEALGDHDRESYPEALSLPRRFIQCQIRLARTLRLNWPSIEARLRSRN